VLILSNDFYVEKFKEFFPDESVKSYLVFLKKNEGFWQDLLYPMGQLILFRTERSKLIAIKINGAAQFVEPMELLSIRFKRLSKQKVEILNTGSYSGVYKLVRCYQTNSTDKEGVIKKLVEGDYDY
jgi:hypothetical protein